MKSPCVIVHKRDQNVKMLSHVVNTLMLSCCQYTQRTLLVLRDINYGNSLDDSLLYWNAEGCTSYAIYPFQVVQIYSLLYVGILIERDWIGFTVTLKKKTLPPGFTDKAWA